MATNTISESKAALLIGLSLGEAFMQHVMKDSRVAEIGAQLMATKPHCAPTFSEGRSPGHGAYYVWNLNHFIFELADAFARPAQPSFDGTQYPPSELENAAAVAIIDAIGSFQGMLASGEIVACGTFVGTGDEVAIGIGQWKRKDIQIDVENSALCEGYGMRPKPLWTGVWIQSPNQRVPMTQSQDAPYAKTRKQISTKEKSRKECLAFILSLISDPDADPLSKDDLWDRVQKKWPEKIGVRQFDECRRDALKQVNEEQRILWTRPGPRGKRS